MVSYKSFINVYYMSGGSDASILGYGNITPFSNVNNSFVNVTSTNNPSNFTSNIIPGTPPGPLPGLAGAKSNIDAASSCVSGACYKGGGMKTPFYRNLKRKIKNITRKYRMRKVRKTKLRKRTSKRKSHTKKRRHYRGGMSAPSYPAGYGQYQNNLPSTPSYSVGGILSGNAELGLANPPPITRMTNSDVDNYNHFTGKTFESRGH